MGEFSRVFRDDITNRQALTVWDILCANGRAQTFFYDRKDMTAPDFLAWWNNPELYPWIVQFKGMPVALVALNDIKGRRAWGHFAFFPVGAARTERRMSVQQGAVLYALASWLHGSVGADGKPVLDYVYGLTPETNRPAVKLVTRMFGEHVTTLPGFCYVADLKANVPGVVSMHTRQTVPAEALEY